MESDNKPMGPNDPPRPVGSVKNIMSANLAGLIFPWRDGEPVLLNVTGANPDTFYLPLFSDEKQLRFMMNHVGVDFESIKEISDGTEFLGGVPNNVKLAIDFRLTEQGTIRWTQVQLH